MVSVPLANCFVNSRCIAERLSVGRQFPCILFISPYFPQSFFGFGQSADIDIYLDGQEARKHAEVKTEDGKKEKLLLYYDGETVSGKVN